MQETRHKTLDTRHKALFNILISPCVQVAQKLKDGPSAERALRSILEQHDADDPARVELIASYIQLLATFPGQERFENAN